METTQLNSAGLNLLYQIISQEQTALINYAEKQKQNPNPTFYYLEKGNRHIEALTQAYNALEKELSDRNTMQYRDKSSCNNLVASPSNSVVAREFPEIWQKADRELSYLLQDPSIGIILIQIDVPLRPTNRAFIHFPAH